MQFIYSNKFFWPIILILTGLIFSYPVQKIQPLIEQLDINHFNNILNQSNATRVIIKELATSGMLTLLLVFTLIGAWLIYIANRTQPWSKPLFICTLCALSLGALGPFFSCYHPYKYVEISAPIKYNEPGTMIANIQFTHLNKKFKHFLDLALEKKIKCYIQTHIIYNENIHKIKLNDTIEMNDRDNIALDTHFLKSFLQNPVLKIETELDSTSQMIYRDLHQTSTEERIDNIVINSKAIEAIKTQKILIYFKFQKPNGEPLAVFL